MIRIRKLKTPLADWEYPFLGLHDQPSIPDASGAQTMHIVVTPVVLEYWDENYGGWIAAEIVD